MPHRGYLRVACAHLLIGWGGGARSGAMRMIGGRGGVIECRGDDWEMSGRRGWVQQGGVGWLSGGDGWDQGDGNG